MSKKKITLDEVLKPVIHEDYLEQVAYVHKLIKAGTLKPMKSSRGNGKSPALALKYWLIEEDQDYSAYKAELAYLYAPPLSFTYYRNHVDVYVKEREDVQALMTFFLKHSDKLNIAVSENERSFQIFHQEKYLKSSAGKRVLAHCEISLEDLHLTKTAEPFAYYASSRKHPQTLLIIENKDPFCGMREHLLAGRSTIMEVPIDTLIYGAGKRILANLKDFEIASEPYMRDPSNTYYYYGDLDYEGIFIYETLAKDFPYPLRPFVPAYQKMLTSDVALLPLSKKDQNKHIASRFFSYFSKKDVEAMKAILSAGRYVPQEYLTISDY